MSTEFELQELFKRKAEDMQLSDDMPESLARRIKRRQRLQGVVAVAAVAVVALGAWGLSDLLSSDEAIGPVGRQDAETQTVESIPLGKESSLADRYPRAFGEVEPGRYVYVELSPDTVIRILPGTFANSGQTSVHLNLPSGGFLDIGNFTGVLSADERFPVPQPLPEDVAAYVQRHPAIEATAPKPVVVGGNDGVEMDIRATAFPHLCQRAVDGGGEAGCLKLFYNPEYSLHAQPDRPTTVFFVEVDGRHLSFAMPTGGASEEEARKMIASIRFLPSDTPD